MKAGIMEYLSSKKVRKKRFKNAKKMLRGVGSSAILLLVRVRAAECSRSDWTENPALAKFSLPSLKKSVTLSLP
jgi:hypothetical protein